LFKKKHVAKKRTAGVWQPAMIRHILTHETYTGLWQYGKTKIVNNGKEHHRQSEQKRGLEASTPAKRTMD
jgi:hypothetical protein